MAGSRYVQVSLDKSFLLRQERRRLFLFWAVFSECFHNFVVMILWFSLTLIPIIVIFNGIDFVSSTFQNN